MKYLLFEKLIVQPQSIHSIKLLLQSCVALTQLLDVVTRLRQDPTFTLHGRAKENLNNQDPQSIYMLVHKNFDVQGTVTFKKLKNTKRQNCEVGGSFQCECYSCQKSCKY